MRSISILVLATILMGFHPVLAQEVNTNTKTKSQFQENLLTGNSIFERPQSEITLPADHPAVEEKLSEEDRIAEAKLARWKAKQAHMKVPQGKFIINASAYTAAADECGKSDGITSSGTKVKEGRTLACPPSYPFGTKIYIKGIGVRVCEDRGGAIKGNHFDIYMETKADAFQFGRRNLEAEVVG